MTFSGMKGGVWLLSFLLVGFTTGQMTPVTNPVTTASCGQNVGCLHYPVDCVSPNCLALLTWAPSADNNSIDFGLMAAADGWVAVGLSDDTLMGSDSVTHCIVNGSNNNAISVGFSFNAGYNNVLGIVNGQYLKNMSASYADNVINCRFTRSIMGDGDRIYTLDYYWYLLLGFGHAIAGVKQKHQYDPQVSSIRVNVLRDFLDVSKPVTAPPRPPTPAPPPCSNCFNDGSGSQVTFSNSSADNTVLINMTSTAVTGSGWLGLGFSYDNIMANDSVIDCILMPNGSVIVKNSYNQPHYNTDIALPTALQGITVINASYVNGLLQCVLQRQINGLSDSHVFNLTASFYLLLARGLIDGQGTKQYHSTRHVSPTAANVVNGFTFSDSLITPALTTTVSPQSPNSPCRFSDRSNNYSVNYQLSGDGTSFDFLIEGPVVLGSWISVGFSYDGFMGNDSVLDCIIGNDNKVIVQNSYNVPQKYNVPVTNSSDGITVYGTTNYTNGMLSCNFSRRISGFQDKNIFPLTTSYYLLIATGPLNSDGSKGKHPISGQPSPQPIDFTSTTCQNLALNPTNGLTPATVSPQSSNSSCSFSDSKNTYTVNYQPSGDGTSFDFLIHGSVSPGSWIAVGFSNDKSMGADSVLDCIVTSDNKVIVQNSYNVPEKYNVPVTNSSDGITVYGTTNYTNGMLSCNFSRRISDFQDSRIFPLTQSYYLLIASGPLNDDGSKGKHPVTGQVSTQQVDFAKTTCQSVQGAGRKNSNAPDPVRLLRAHGVLMITAFVMIMSSSIIIARYYRTCWPEDTICKTAVWFAVHRFLMILSLCLCAAGFIIIFCFSDGWLYREYSIGTPSYFWAHGPIGIVVMILIIMNPIISAFRCKPDHDYRAIFNWLHWTVGTCCHVLGGINLFFGIKMGEISYNISHTAVFWILIAFVGFHVFTEILLSIEKIITERQTQNSFTINYAMSEPGHEPKAHKEQVHIATRGSLLFRYFFLALYTLVTMGLWLAMIILIGGGYVNNRTQ